MEPLFADIVLPLPLPATYTYRVPSDMAHLAVPLRRAVVPFGAKDKIVTGIITCVHHTAPSYKTKYINDIPEDFAWFNALQWQFFEWMAAYYMARPGEVLHAAMPAGLKIGSESRISYNTEFDFFGSDEMLTDDETDALKFIKSNDSINYTQLSEYIGRSSVYALLKSLCAKKAVILYEELKQRYRPRLKKMVRLAPGYLYAEVIETLFEELEKKPKQAQLILKFLREVPVLSHPEKNTAGLEKAFLMAGEMSASALATMVKNGIFEEFDLRISRIKLEEVQKPLPELSPAQQEALGVCMHAYLEKEAVLLRGVTGSGKTAVYMHLIHKVLSQEKQVLFMLPEIALTTQMLSRLGAVFGDKMAVYHSKYSDNERMEVWEGVLTGKFNLVVGVRSSVFLPFSDLGLVIVDEEHEPSYKQQDPAPRYHGRDAALMLARMHGAKTLLGSATPSVEMYHLANTGRMAKVEMQERYGGVQMPEIIFADLRSETKRKTLKGPFSSLMLQELDDCTAHHKQAIFFQNRRGYSPYVLCEDCGWVPECEECAVSLTFHMQRNELRCHHSGHKMKKPDTCPACGSYKIKPVGFGTEKLEDDLRALRSNLRIARMDSDTTSSKFGFADIIASVESGKTDVLIGTQMVTKGLDFENVHLVGIFDIDRILHYPDFRSSERVFQLICQVSGRAGRRGNRGKVVIQTMQPDVAILQLAARADYPAFFDLEIIERQKYAYPPFTRLIKLSARHREQETARDFMQKIAEFSLQQLPAQWVLGPEAPMIYKIRNEFIFELLIKMPRRGFDTEGFKKLLHHRAALLNNEPAFKSLRLSVDVDVMF